MAGDEFTLFLRTSLDPQHLIMTMREKLGLSVPVTTFLWKTSPRDVVMYECELPFERINTTEDGAINVAACNLPVRLIISVSELFETVGMEKNPPNYVQVELTVLNSDLYWESYYQILRALGAILQSVSGDCFWSRTLSSIPILIRRNDQVLSDPTIHTWSGEEKQALGLAITLEKIPYDPDR